MFRGNNGFRLKYKLKHLAFTWIDRQGGFGIYGISGNASKKDKKALVIYTAEAVSAWLSGKLDRFNKLQSHSGFRESLLMLELLLEKGYTVDFLHLYDTPRIQWEQYELVIDAGQNMQQAIPVKGQKRVYYASSCHWKTFRENQLIRSTSFYERHGLMLKPDRDIEAGYADDAADVITCFGGSYQVESFGKNAAKVKALNLSCTHLPEGFRKRLTNSKKFMWYGGYGPFHKGLDLVVEAFRDLPDCELHIMGHAEQDPRFFEWFKSQLGQSPNLHYHGWVTPESPLFYKLATDCDGTVFASSSEGGAGSVLQAMQFGLIPLVNTQTALREAGDHFPVSGSHPLAEIASICEQVRRFVESPSEEQQSVSEQIRDYCLKNHSTEAYRQSLGRVLDEWK